MIRKSKNDLHWLEFELFSEEPKLVHAIFLRHGGVSKGVYCSLNFIKGIADDPNHVKENQRRALDALGIKTLICAEHVHGAHIEWVKAANQNIGEADGLMTNQKNIGLIATHADCQAAIFYDPIHLAIATVHAGWRGQAQNIYKKTVLKMAETFCTKAEDLLVAISPSLGPENAEFQNYQEELPQEFWRFQVKPSYFNLWEIARHQLEESGVLSHHIQIAGIDTFATPEDFFSYRRQKKAGHIQPVTGCHGTIAALT